MPTPLFPAQGTPITINQGAVGDCYLLASLDCIFNTGDDGYKLIKSMFTETALRVTVRIKHNDHSAYLKPHLLAGEYTYHYDDLHNEDVFIISRAKLNEIDCSPIGVTTNSLAVRILEQLSSHYYEHPWDSTVAMASVLAHNTSERRYQSTSTAFVGKLLGIGIDESLDVNEIIKLKTICPAQPVYVSMQYGAADGFGHIHSAHAFRIDKIVPKRGSPDEYDFILVNPWDNQKRETYSLADISPRIRRFCIYMTHPEQHELTLLLLNLSIEQGKYIFSSPHLLDMILQEKRLSPTFCMDDIARCIAQYQQAYTVIAACIKDINELPVTFDAKSTLLTVDNHKLSLLQQLRERINHDEQLIEAHRMLGLEDGLYHEDLIKAFENKSVAIRYEAHQKRLNIERAKSTIATCVSQINALQVSFDSADSGLAVDMHSARILTELVEMIQRYPQLTEALSTLGLTDKWHESIEMAVDRYKYKINAAAVITKQKIASRIAAEKIIELSDFQMHLSMINDAASEMEEVAKTDDNYQQGALSARALHTALVLAKKHFLTSGKPEGENLHLFQADCLNAINEAQLVLGHTLCWKKIFADMIRALLSIITVDLVTLATGKFRFFVPGSIAARGLEDVEVEIVFQDVP